jgi:hypothetical protein
MTEELATPRDGINRRELLRRSLVVGGAGVTVWAAPTVTAFAPRAFAQTGSEEPDPGTGQVSWAMIWFARGGLYHRVKYEATGSGYSTLCNAQKSNLSMDEPIAVDYFVQQEAKAAGLVYSPDCPPGVSDSATSTGSLTVTVSDGTQIIGWILHDGTCRQVTKDPRPPAVRSSDHHLKDPNDPDMGSAGPPAGSLPSASGIFVWQNCSVGAKTTSVAEHDALEEQKAEEQKAEEQKAEEQKAEEQKAEEQKGKKPKAEEQKAEKRAPETTEGSSPEDAGTSSDPDAFDDSLLEDATAAAQG